MAAKDLTGPFRIAFNGIVHTFRTQRHMRVHLYVTLIVVLGALMLNMRMREILVLLFMVTFVLVAEMFNSAIEAVVDLVSPNYHPLAKFAKDISAGAVLVTTIMAIVVGAMIALGDDNWERIRVNLATHEWGIPIAVRYGAGVIAVIIVVIIGKGLGKHGQVLRGGHRRLPRLPSSPGALGGQDPLRVRTDPGSHGGGRSGNPPFWHNA